MSGLFYFSQFLWLALGGWLIWVIVDYQGIKKELRFSVALLLQNQAEVAEGFIHHFIRQHPSVQFVLVDSGSSDDTPYILQILSNKFNLAYYLSLEKENLETDYCLDVRNLQEKDLLGASLDTFL